MGNREDLLAGAITCLREKGWARTTVRDIAAAAGVSHAAIGYHFGSREALLTTALIKALDEWGTEIDEEVRSSVGTVDAPDEFTAMWAATVRSFSTLRPMWRATVDALLQAEHNPKLRELLAAGQEEGRRGGAAGLLGVAEEDVSAEAARTLGSVYSALLSGVMMQWLLDPEAAPSGADVVAGLRAMAALAGRSAEDDHA
jgi:AcrR family transcriptional regulator